MTKAGPAQSSLANYRAKREFTKTSEPAGKKEGPASSKQRFVIQRHDATRLHYDFRLELDGVFKSWAVTRGPSLDPHDRRLADQLAAAQTPRRRRRRLRWRCPPEGPQFKRLRPQPCRDRGRQGQGADVLHNAQGHGGRRRVGIKEREETRQVLDEGYAAFHRTATLQAGRAGHLRARLGARDQVRRLSHATPCRKRRGTTPYAEGTRLDRQVRRHREGRQRAARLPTRWRGRGTGQARRTGLRSASDSLGRPQDRRVALLCLRPFVHRGR